MLTNAQIAADYRQTLEDAEAGGYVEAVRQIYCLWTFESGARCRARAMKGSYYCYWHDPDKSKERETGLVVDQPARSTLAPPILPGGASLETAADVVLLLQKVALYLAGPGEVEPRRATALNAVAANLLQALHLRELEQHLAEANAEIARLRQALEEAQP